MLFNRLGMDIVKRVSRTFIKGLDAILSYLLLYKAYNLQAKKYLQFSAKYGRFLWLAFVDRTCVW